MMRYFDRYMNGEHEAVWAEFANLGTAVREEKIFADAKAVALETMGRVKKNIDTIISRLVLYWLSVRSIS